MTDRSASDQIDDIISLHGGWKADVLKEIRQAVKAASADIVEQVKWKTASRPEGLPVWSLDGVLCIAEVWKDNVKLIFFKGALLADSDQVFNARLKSRTDRAIEYREEDQVDEAAVTQLVEQAIELNQNN